jgi:bacterioferritin-associated ferredoxin
MKVHADLQAQDWIEMDTEDPKHLKVIGCTATLNLIRSCKQAHGEDLSKWPLPEGFDHSSLLLKEALQKRAGDWRFPYAHEELCHCRAVSAERVNQAILAGAHTAAQVSRLTSASTACGTCRPEVENLLRWRGVLK